MKESVNATDTLEALRQEIARLSERVAALEKLGGWVVGSLGGSEDKGAGSAPTTQPPNHPTTQPDEALSEELILVISAAIAAFLGKKPHIRQIRLVSTAAWAQQGRATIQASHALPVHHGRS
jgi:methylmalonyl-CoA carboxyltransferase 12S subunit